MIKSRARCLFALSVTLACASMAHAEGFYVGGALSAPDYSDQVNGYGDGHGGRGLGGKLYGGYQFTPNFSIEAGVMNLGRTQDTGGSATGYGAFVDGVGLYSFAPRWSVLGRLGVADARLTTPAGSTDSMGLKVGAGVQYDLTTNVALRLEYEQYRMSSAFNAKPDIGQVALGIKVNF